MSKKVNFVPKPTVKTPDQWVQGAVQAVQPKNEQGSAQADNMKRFTIDVSSDLHARIKVACALRGTKMSDEIRTLLERHFAK